LACPGTNTLLQGVCGPPPSKYLTSTYDLSSCAGLCTTCKSSFDYCHSCYTGTYSANLISPAQCDCLFSKYQDTPTTCGYVNCNAQCAGTSNCTGPGGMFCTFCKDEHNANVNGKCICWELNKGQNGGVPGMCDKCHETCQTCSWANDPTKCTSCGVGAMLDAIQGECICPLGMEVGANKLCTAISSYSNCHATCNTCAGPASNQCSSCRSDSSLSTGSCSCSSPTAYMDSFGKCRPCHSTCQACSNGASTGCLSCSDTDTVLLTNGTCIKKWVNGCHPTCATCIGPSAN
jgi:proprotein convertase subtilisin/kexin type 5